MTDEEKKILTRANLLAWVLLNEMVNEKGDRIRLEKGTSFHTLQALYKDEAKKIVVRKPSQYGVSTWAILKAAHKVSMRGYNAIHTLPTLGDVQKFVPSKVNAIVKNNKAIRGDMPDTEVDAVGQKQFGKGFWYFKGTFTERESLMLTSDLNLYDELNKSDLGSISDYQSRQEGEGSAKEEVWLSTPTVPGFGIDAKFTDSDQKHWRFNCPHCKKEQHMRWPENVDMKRGIYICSHCTKRITNEDIANGFWRARFPGRKISGYWLTQMIAPWVEASELVEAYKEAEKENKLDYFYNHKLGMPYISSESGIDKSMILRNCVGRKQHLETGAVMGVDVQLRELYAVVGNDEGVWGILRIEDKPSKSKWERLGEIMDVYEIRFCVIDGGFTPNEVVDFAKRYPHRVFVNWYKEDPKKAKIVRFGDDDFQAKEHKTFVEEIRILTDRDRMMELTVADLKKGKPRFLYEPDDGAIELMVRHVQTTYARTVTDRLGREKREWISTGEDDLLHALNYWKIARMRATRKE